MINTKEKSVSKDAFQFKGSMLTVSVLHLYDRDLMRFETEMNNLVAKTPKLFVNMPVIIDISLLDGNDSIDFQGLKQRVRQAGLIPIGLRGGNPIQKQIAELAGLCVLPQSKATEKPLEAKTKKVVAEEPKQDVKKTPPKAHSNHTQSKIIKQPVRSGQQIYAKNSDLIITAAVSPGSEILADGSIHVYGTLRGRALAGISGDSNARIFCHSMEAELISIAGIFLVSEQLKAINQPTQIYLEEDHLIIKPF